MKLEYDEIKHYFEVIEKDGINLTTWEEEFIESIKKQFEFKGYLSDKQIEILERIYSDRTP